MILTFPAPCPLVGDSLKAEIIAAGFECRSVSLCPAAAKRPGQVGDELDIVTDAAVEDIAPIVAAHKGEMVRPDPDEIRWRAVAALQKNLDILAHLDAGA